MRKRATFAISSERPAGCKRVSVKCCSSVIAKAITSSQYLTSIPFRSAGSCDEIAKVARKLILAFLCLLAGCKVGPNYHPPALDIPEAFQKQVEDNYEALNLEWWQQFNDPVLEELIAEALLNNQDVKIAAANIENALGQLIQVRSQLFPQIGYTEAFSRTLYSSNLTSNAASNAVSATSSPLSQSTSAAAALRATNPQSVWQSVLTGSWEIDLWGRIRRLSEAAAANAEAFYEARQGVILSLVSSVANSYIQLRGLDEQLVVSLRTQKSYAEAVEYFDLQFKYGQASEILVAQAKTQYEIASAQVPQLRYQILQVENVINVLLARNPGPIARGKSIYDLQLPLIPAELPSELLTQRPDIRQAEEQLIAANAKIGAALALYYPSISLTGYYGGASLHLSNLFTGPSKTWNYTGTITGPIFTAGGIYGQVVQAQATQQAALHNYQKTIQSAFADVEDALYNHTMIKERLVAEELLVKAAGNYERLSELQYKGGYSPYFIVIQAQQQYFPAQLSWAQTKALLFSSVVNIYRAMGGGWVTTARQTADGIEPCL